MGVREQRMSVLVKLNGAYDIACALSILRYVPLPIFSTIHVAMFRDYHRGSNDRFERFLGYWIFTYGLIRLFGIEPRIIALSYFIEAAVIMNEMLRHNTVIQKRGLFVVVSCAYSGYMTLQQ